MPEEAANLREARKGAGVELPRNHGEDEQQQHREEADPAAALGPAAVVPTPARRRGVVRHSA
jgi:hypothetical protein